MSFLKKFDCSRHLPKSDKQKILLHLGFIKDLPKTVRLAMGKNERILDQVHQWSDIIASLYGLGIRL
jgi:hypothetical protein